MGFPRISYILFEMSYYKNRENVLDWKLLSLIGRQIS
jgi:hypothetical protein